MQLCATIIVISSQFYALTESFIWNFGDCAVYYEEACSQSVVRFIYHRHGRLDDEVSLLDPFHLDADIIKPNSTNMKILIHGYGGLGIDFAIRNVSAAYKETGVPVIVVDWTSLATIPCYPTAFFNTWHVGQCIAILSVSLATLGIPPTSIHIIGFSLGAHIASFASNHIEKALGVPFKRITGLDPALPLFATLVNEWKLDPTDADFVDVYHTSAGSFGKLEAIGHVDFYINGGAMQPNCLQAKCAHPAGEKSNLNNKCTLADPQLCSHFMVGQYYASTVRNYKEHLGYACPSILHWYTGFCPTTSAEGVAMGEYVIKKLRGIYFVETQPTLRTLHASN